MMNLLQPTVTASSGRLPGLCEVFFAAAKKQRSMDICVTHPFYSTSPVGQLVSKWRCASRETRRHTGKLFWLWLCSFWFVFDVGLQNVLHTGVDQRRIVQWRVAKTREAGGPGPCMHLYYMQGKGWIKRLSFILPWTALPKRKTFRSYIKGQCARLYLWLRIPTGVVRLCTKHFGCSFCKSSSVQTSY